jgi:hypothetical protein
VQQHCTYAEMFGSHAALCHCYVTALQVGLGLQAEGNNGAIEMEANGIWFWYQHLDPVSVPLFIKSTACSSVYFLPLHQC